MYLSKDSLKKLYSKLNCLVPEKMVDGKTVVSAIRYFLATDEFKKKEQRSCDTNKKDDDEKFVDFVGHVVFLSKESKSASLYTKNFAELLGAEKDYKVQSNFFTQGQVRISKATKKAEPYPSGSGSNALLVCDDGVVDIAENGYQVFAEKYLQNDILKFTLLFIWLNRYTGFNSRDSIYEDFLNELQKNYTEILCETLQWNSVNVKQVFEQVISEYTFEDSCSYLEKNDIVDDEFTQLLKNVRTLLNEGNNKNRLSEFLKTINLDESEENGNESGSDDESRHSQIIYYGVPGCGKSHAVDKIINDTIADFNKGKNAENKITYEKQVIRTVFHPDYCYADFVGQIMPKKERDGGIKYEFKPGPLANIIRKAYLNPAKPYFLIIEEINRGNASAIFGETFQLLDRYKNGKHSSEEEIRNENYDYTEGWSKYSINNDDLNGFILLGGESEVTEKESGVVYESDSSETPKSAIKIPSRNMHFSTYSGVRLPPNLSLYATMNTSDQNVFTLDNAFQRRWEMKQISNKLDEKEKKLDGTPGDQQVQYNKIIGNTDVKWGDFREKINEIIMQSAEENGLSSMEDKRLGGWFIVPKKAPGAAENAKPEITTQAFAEKVLKYLWDDAFKFDRKSHFADGEKSFKTLESLIDSFNEKGFKVFKDETIKNLQVKTSLKSSAESDAVTQPDSASSENINANPNGQSNT